MRKSLFYLALPGYNPPLLRSQNRRIKWIVKLQSELREEKYGYMLAWTPLYPDKMDSLF